MKASDKNINSYQIKVSNWTLSLNLVKENYNSKSIDYPESILHATSLVLSSANTVRKTQGYPIKLMMSDGTKKRLFFASKDKVSEILN